MGENEVHLQQIFSSVDTNCSGRIEYDELATICRDLNVQTSQVDSIFRNLDADRDGTITFSEFTQGFRCIAGILQESGSIERPSGTHVNRTQLEARGGGPAALLAWEQFAESLGESAQLLSREEAVGETHQQIHGTSNSRLLSQYEKVIQCFLQEIERQQQETERIAFSARRAQEIAGCRLSELEDEMEQRLQRQEEKIRQEERAKMENSVFELKRQHKSEVGELESTITKLRKLENLSRAADPKEDVLLLKKQLNNITLENQELKKNLLEAQTNIMVLQSEIDSLKTDLTNHSMNMEQDNSALKELTDEKFMLEKQVELLQSTNRKLYDNNDNLRAALENTLSMHKQAANSTRVTSLGLPLNRSTPQSSADCRGRTFSPTNEQRINTQSFIEDETDSLAACDPMRNSLGESQEVESWNEYDMPNAMHEDGVDIEPGQWNQRTFPHPPSTGYASDTDGDWQPSRPVSRSSSNASTRRTISAFSAQIEKSTLKRTLNKPNRVYKLVLAGDAAVGKSSFLLRLCKNEFHSATSATLGVDFQMKTLIVDGQQMTLQLWDTAGQERFRSIAKSYFRKADGVLLLYDVTFESTFLNVREWIDSIEDSTSHAIPVMLVGNKTDLREKAQRVGQNCVMTSFGEKLAMTYHALFCETSAKDGSNIVEAVLHLAREVRKKAAAADRASIVIVDDSKSSGKCCKV